MASGSTLSRACTLSSAALQPVEEQDPFNIQPDAVGSLFGSSRMGMGARGWADTALTTSRTRTAAFHLARSLGQTVPEDFLGALVVFHFQRTALWTRPPHRPVLTTCRRGMGIRLRELGVVWVIPCAADETQAGDFQLIRSAFDSLEIDLRHVNELLHLL